jgi:hypothetical protein
MTKTPQKDSFYGKAALYLSLGFWIPLFNIGLCATSIYLAIRALKQVDENPERYDGKNQAVIALVLSSTSILLTLIGTAIYLKLN